MPTISEVKLVISDGVYIEKTPIAYIAADPIIIAANMYERYVISKVNETTIFDHSTTNITYSLSISEYCGAIIPLNSIASLYKNHRADKAKIHTDNVKEYTTIIKSIYENKDDHAYGIISKLVSLSKLNIERMKSVLNPDELGVTQVFSNLEKDIKSKNLRFENDVKYLYCMALTSILENIKL